MYGSTSFPRLLKCFFVLLLLANGYLIRGQSRAAVFLEGGGGTPFYSLNYAHRIFGPETAGTYLRIGAGIWKKQIAFPVGLTILVGKKDHYLEISPILGAYFQGLQFWDRDRSDLLIDLTLGLAYRFQPAKATFFVAAGFFPYLDLDPTSSTISEKQTTLNLRPGLSLGKRF